MPLTRPSVNTRGRIMYFWIETDTEWVSNYSEAHRAAYGFSDDGIIHNCRHGIWILGQETGIKPLEVTRGNPINTVVDPSTGEKREEIVKLNGGGGVNIIVVCNSQDRSFNRRPTQAQMDLLQETMDGKKPQWWVSYF